MFISKLSIILQLPLLLTLCLASQSALAEPTKFGSFMHHSEAPHVLFLNGQIGAGDSFELRRAMRTHEIKLVVTASPGGSLYEGLQIASIIHDNTINTYVPENTSCESSCANVFFGGASRAVMGNLGVHQFYDGSDGAARSVGKDVATSAAQYTTSEIIGIMNQFETPAFVYEKMFGTNEIYYFQGAQKQRLNRGTSEPELLDLMTEADELIASDPSVIDRPEDADAQLEVAQLPAKPLDAVKPGMSSPAARVVKRFEDTDFFGKDLTPKGLRNVSLLQCETFCQQTSQCAAYSYVASSRWCWPKSGVENVSVAYGTTSGIIDYSRVNSAVLDRPFIESSSTDIPGYDLLPRGLQNTSLEECRYVCLSSSNCRAFSWVIEKNWCFPKYGTGQTKQQWGIISGFRQ